MLDMLRKTDPEWAEKFGVLIKAMRGLINVATMAEFAEPGSDASETATDEMLNMIMTVADDKDKAAECIATLLSVIVAARTGMKPVEWFNTAGAPLDEYMKFGEGIDQ